MEREEEEMKEMKVREMIVTIILGDVSRHHAENTATHTTHATALLYAIAPTATQTRDLFQLLAAWHALLLLTVTYHDRLVYTVIAGNELLSFCQHTDLCVHMCLSVSVVNEKSTPSQLRMSFFVLSLASSELNTTVHNITCTQPTLEIP